MSLAMRQFSRTFLRECFVYDRHTGDLVWRHRPIQHFNSSKYQKMMNTRVAGKVAGNPGMRGYLQVRICGVLLPAHHICWVLGTGRYPKGETDHINGKRLDNRLVNLRDVTGSVNHKNSKIRKDNTTGVVGVSFDSRDSLFAAQATIAGKQVRKCFKTLEAAVEWRQQMVAVAGDYSATHGRPN